MKIRSLAIPLNFCESLSYRSGIADFKHRIIYYDEALPPRMKEHVIDHETMHLLNSTRSIFWHIRHDLVTLWRDATDRSLRSERKLYARRLTATGVLKWQMYAAISFPLCFIMALVLIPIGWFDE